jgi:hypothetical protein
LQAAKAFWRLCIEQLSVQPPKGTPPPDDPPWPDISEHEQVAAGQEQMTLYVAPSMQVSVPYSWQDGPPSPLPLPPPETVRLQTAPASGATTMPHSGGSPGTCRQITHRPPRHRGGGDATQGQRLGVITEMAEL